MLHNREQIKLVILGLNSDWKDDTVIGYIPYHITFLAKNGRGFKEAGFKSDAEMMTKGLTDLSTA